MSVDRLHRSSWFDAEWYQARYPDVALSGMPPARHYLELGERWGRQPGPDFDPQWYLAAYPDVARAKVSPLLHFIRHGEAEGRLPVRVAAQEHEQALWRRHAGDPSPSLAALEALRHASDWREAGYAAWALGRWYAWQDEWQRVAEVLASGHHRRSRRLPRHTGPWLLEADALTRLGHLARARECLDGLAAAAPGNHDVTLARANLVATQRQAPADSDCREAERLALLNALWRAHGLAEVQRANTQLPLTLDNLAPRDTDHTAQASSRVSVIVPVYNAAASLPAALAGLAAQRGVDLEVIVVDDASRDGSAEIARGFAERDSRFRLLRQPFNQGAYTARNRGLAAASGEFITVHDSDDWPHPDKLAVQVRGLEHHPQWVACNSHWVRCTTDLMFGHWRPGPGWIYRNTSSLMLRRHVFDTLGFWDRVRVDADTEYYYRIRAAFGARALGEVLPGVPLAFGRSAARSLSQAGQTHLVTQFAGLRHDYQQAAQAWHRQALARGQTLYLPERPAQRPFAAPAAMLP
ncbi:glycosyltransferase family 2 protein [Halomonas piscis]|uniref:glycosyltransferase family 2 protein n=1 Tax=Halomonas piscis TaxID=3031727 RepID=UPI00289C3ECB|nr:glycosyltransferase family A protein [Halomonas piscis]